MNIYIVGNPLVKEDKGPHVLIPELVRFFPEYSVEEIDPNEDFIPGDGSVIIDTVEGITNPQWFDSIDSFIQTKSVSAHDYDLGFHLLFLRKLHKLNTVKILGVPKGDMTDARVGEIISLLHTIPATIT